MSKELSNNHFYQDAPIRGMVRYANSVEIKRKTPMYRSKNSGGSRGKIRYLSRSSLNRLAFTVLNSNSRFLSILTLTYSERWTSNGQDVKRHLNKFLVMLRKWYERPSYLWFLEFQKRGAPHFHILVSYGPVHQDDRDWLADTWCRIVGEVEPNYSKMIRVHKHLKSWEDIRKADGAKRYALKYALKPEQKIVPTSYQDVGRFWGASRDVIRSAHEVVFQEEMSEFDVRLYLKAVGLDNVSEWEFLPRHIWVVGSEDEI